MTDDRFWNGIWWVPDGEGPGLRSATPGECCAEIVRLRDVMRECCDAIRDNDGRGALRMMEAALLSKGT